MTQDRLPDKALAAAALSALTWGLTGVFIKLLPAVAPVSVTAGRLLFAFLALLPAIVFSTRLRHGFIQAARSWLAALLALQMAAYYLVATAAFQLAPVAEVALLVSTQPVFVQLLRRLTGEPTRRSEILGTVLALAGILLVLAQEIRFSGERSSAALLGNLLAIVAAVLSAGFSTLYGRLSARGGSPDATGVTLLAFLIGASLTGAWVLLMGGTDAEQLMSAKPLLLLLGLGLVSTAVPSLGFALASRSLPAMVASTISLLIPVSSGFFAWWLIGEKLSLNYLMGALLVLMGVAVIIRR